MPTYQYACTECGDRLEVVQRFSDDPLSVCAACGGRLRKVFSPVGIVFKGSGFYRTDSRSADVNGKDRAAVGADSGSGSAEGGSSDGRSSDGRSSDGRSSDGRSSDGRSSDGRSSDGRSSESGSAASGSAGKSESGSKPDSGKTESAGAGSGSGRSGKAAKPSAASRSKRGGSSDIRPKVA